MMRVFLFFTSRKYRKEKAKKKYSIVTKYDVTVTFCFPDFVIIFLASLRNYIWKKATEMEYMESNIHAYLCTFCVVVLFCEKELRRKCELVML